MTHVFPLGLGIYKGARVTGTDFANDARGALGHNPVHRRPSSGRSGGTPAPPPHHPAQAGGDCVRGSGTAVHSYPAHAGGDCVNGVRGLGCVALNNIGK